MENTLTYEMASEVDRSTRQLRLEFAEDVPARIRPRIEYAFRVFAAVYGHSVSQADSLSRSLRILYGDGTSRRGDPTVIHVPALYSVSTCKRLSLLESTPLLHDYAGHTFPLLLGLDTESGEPDWLGEIFVWLSGELELHSTKRDSAGRVPFSETAFGRHGISTRQPHAALLMSWFENTLQNGATPALPRAPSPLPGFEHVILASHDIDFYYGGPASALVRFAKNLVIAAVLYKNASFFFDNLRMSAGLFAGRRPGSFLPDLLEATQKQGFQTTILPVVRHAHRRDPNYSFESFLTVLTKAVAHGFSLGLHASYRSAMEDRSISSEAATLGERLGKWPSANRQHWLRFESHDRLFREVEAAGILVDSSLGFPETVGFRNGANFAFPPYDFQRECPHRFLEVPLVLMDGGLEAEARKSGDTAQAIADGVLQASRNSGWGGISVLWHNPLEPISVPGEINEVFWNCAARRGQFRETWLTFDEFLALVVPRYQRAGLLEGVGANA